MDNPWLLVAAKYAAAARTDRQAWLDVRHLAGDGWEALRREYGLPAEPPAASTGPVAAVAVEPLARIGELACVHLGEPLRRQQCPTCTGAVEVKVMACSIYGEATVSKPLPGVACCGRCPSYRAKGA